ncbi:hypothetical protein [Ponticaulis profundi]|jgi:hypothetical protein|uniref:Uncharacterized protein n=1 Tax=Ponticaulis profundi TaxID=2665222 RepID=A0ABW1SBE8_9PROT
MKETIDDIKAAIREFLRTYGQPVEAKTPISKKEHLEVWTIGGRYRAAGLELNHARLVNFWVTSMNIPPDLPNAVEITRKTPKGGKWTDANGNGANSNLSSYDQFRTKPIARLAVTSSADAFIILTHLNR